MANEDDFDSLEATDKVKVLIKKISEDVVFPTSFGLSLDLPEHNIVAGTMTREDAGVEVKEEDLIAWYMETIEE